MANGLICTSDTVQTFNVSNPDCDGFPYLSLQECKDKCTDNEMPKGCKKENIECKYVIWQPQISQRPRHCHLADDNCFRVDRPQNMAYQMWEKIEGENLNFSKNVSIEHYRYIILMDYCKTAHVLNWFLDPCNPNPCKHHGECRETSVDVFSCACPKSFSGKRCETEQGKISNLRVDPI